MADNTTIIDRDTYRSIKKMSREELQGFLMRYAENLTKDSPVIELQKLEQDIKSIKGIGDKRAEEEKNVIEKHPYLHSAVFYTFRTK